MTSFDQVHQQNHRIVELSNVLKYLVQKRLMCDADITRDLFFEFVHKVKEHSELVDREFYGILLRSSDQHAHDTAELFMSGSLEIKRIFQKYLKKWSSGKRQELRIADHDDFIKDSSFMFKMVQNRIQRETEILYPMVRELRESTGY